MKNIELIELEKYADANRFEKISEGIYKALDAYNDDLVEKGHYVTAFSFTLEEELGETEDRQYPLEDLLDKFLAHVSEFIQDEPDNPVMKLELCTQDWLAEMQELIKIRGKRVYNKEVIENGETYLELVIE
jgi:hypothetical protein